MYTNNVAKYMVVHGGVFVRVVFQKYCDDGECVLNFKSEGKERISYKKFCVLPLINRLIVILCDSKPFRTFRTRVRISKTKPYIPHSLFVIVVHLDNELPKISSYLTSSFYVPFSDFRTR